MTFIRSAAAPLTLLSATLAATVVLAADGPLSGTPAAPVEQVGPAAAGDPKPFRVFVQAECEGVQCLANFGKKGKVRNVKWISCGISTEGGMVQLAQVVLTDPDVPAAFLGAVSRAATLSGETAILEFSQPFQVPAGEFLRIELITDGEALGSQCIVAGTLQ